jgi:hypothetical protein
MFRSCCSPRARRNLPPFLPAPFPPPPSVLPLGKSHPVPPVADFPRMDTKKSVVILDSSLHILWWWLVIFLIFLWWEQCFEKLVYRSSATYKHVTYCDDYGLFLDVAITPQSSFHVIAFVNVYVVCVAIDFPQILCSVGHVAHLICLLHEHCSKCFSVKHFLRTTCESCRWSCTIKNIAWEGLMLHWSETLQTSDLK